MQASNLRTFLLLLAALATLSHCKGGASPAGSAGASGSGAKKAPSAFPVETQTVTLRELEYTLTAVGSVVAFEEAQVTARVAGSVEKVSFVEGDRVEADAVLAEIEPRRYRIAVEQAQATQRRAAANLADAKKILQRRKEMGPEVAAGEEIETAEAKYRVAEAELAQAKAALDLAELNLHDARVRAPVAGRVEARRVQTGSYVQPGAVIATILRTDPLRVRFAVSETDAQRLQRDMPIRFRIRGVEGTRTATIRHIGGRADEGSRLVDVFAVIEGDTEGLRPGAFAEVVVPVGAKRPAPVVPQTAIRPSEKGFLAFVIEGGKAKERVLQLGMRTEDNLVEVVAGLKGGEQLVTIGGEALRDGAQVKVVPASLPGAGRDRPASGEVSVPASPTAVVRP